MSQLTRIRQEAPAVGALGSHQEVESKEQRSSFKADRAGRKPDVGFAGIDGFIEDARQRTKVADTFDLSLVTDRYRREHGFSQDIVEGHRRELIRFLALSATATNNGRYYGMMGAIDELWHTFVIFTREYSEFCQAVAGRFLHHVPEADGQASPETLDHYLAFLSDYETVYGEPPTSAYWPNPNRKKIDAATACKGCSACNGCTSDPCTVH